MYQIKYRTYDEYNDELNKLEAETLKIINNAVYDEKFVDTLFM